MIRFHILYLVIIGVLLFFVFKTPKTKTEFIKVTVPAQIDSFEVIKPVPVYVDTNTSLPQVIYIPTNLPPSKCLEEYNHLYNVCDSMTRIRAYSNNYIDSIFLIVGIDTIWINMDITVKDTTQGILNKQQMKYTITPKTNFTTITPIDSYKNTIFVGGGFDFSNKNIIGAVGYDTKKYVLNYSGNIVESNHITLGIKLNRK